MDRSDGSDMPLFSAISGSTRQLYNVLKCINFVSKAQVRITSEGLRFTVEESQVMQGVAILNKELFTTYSYTVRADGENEEEEDSTVSFQISLSALLETLQILGINEAKDRWSTRDPAHGGAAGFLNKGGPAVAFEHRTLGMASRCRLSYASKGSPLCIVLEEAGVTTTCELYTFEPEYMDEIPLQRDAIAQKIIMRAEWLHDAIVELSSTSPTKLTMVASPTAPHFTLSSAGPLGSATVEFSKNAQLLETFQVKERSVNTYKYSLIKDASRAMAVASKVSIRADEQGVLSLQFMIETEGDNVSFVDFRFVPLLPEEDDEEGIVDEPPLG
ncbi:MAG: hypothetical protein LQ351_001076 [Letrouitia transgressa]|nr:MAG: hypothetical protein LQ351_001076 [Letrouitia transgressa]